MSPNLSLGDTRTPESSDDLKLLSWVLLTHGAKVLIEHLTQKLMQHTWHLSGCAEQPVEPGCAGELLWLSGMSRRHLRSCSMFGFTQGMWASRGVGDVTKVCEHQSHLCSAVLASWREGSIREQAMQDPG